MISDKVKGLVEGFGVAVFDPQDKVQLPKLTSLLLPKGAALLASKVNLFIEGLKGALLWEIIKAVVEEGGVWSGVERDYLLKTEGLGVEIKVSLRLIAPEGREAFVDIVRDLEEINPREVAEKGALIETMGGSYYVALPLRDSLSLSWNAPVHALVGKNFWDFLGGEGSYEEVLKGFKEAGQALRGDILRLLGG